MSASQLYRLLLSNVNVAITCLLSCLVASQSEASVFTLCDACSDGLPPFSLPLGGPKPHVGRAVTHRRQLPGGPMVREKGRVGKHACLLSRPVNSERKELMLAKTARMHCDMRMSLTSVCSSRHPVNVMPGGLPGTLRGHDGLSSHASCDEDHDRPGRHANTESLYVFSLML